MSISFPVTAAAAQDTLAEIASTTPLESLYKKETPTALSKIILGNNKIVFDNAKAVILTRYQGKLKTHPQGDDDFFSNTMDDADIYSVTNAGDKSLKRLGSSEIHSVAIEQQLDAQGMTNVVICLSEYQDLNNYYYKSGKFMSCTTYRK